MGMYKIYSNIFSFCSDNNVLQSRSNDTLGMKRSGDTLCSKSVTTRKGFYLKDWVFIDLQNLFYKVL